MSNSTDLVSQSVGPLEIAQTISRSVLFTLGRQYLDRNFSDINFIQPIVAPASGLLEKPQLLRIDQVGSSFTRGIDQAFTALQTTLTACHHPDRYTLIFIVSSDGKLNRLYLGSRSQDPDVYSSANFAGYLSQFIQGTWPGTRTIRSAPSSDEYSKYIQQPLDPHKGLRYVVSLTGIPSFGSAENLSYPQSLDRFLRGMRGNPYMYVVIAEPMSHAEIDQILSSCREAIGQVHSLAKIMFTDTVTVGITETEGTTITEGESNSRGFTETKGASFGIGQLPLQGFLMPLHLSGTYSFAKTNTFTSQWSTAKSLSTAISKSNARALGQEYINAHAQAAEEQLQRYIARLEQARALGCWKTGVYLLAQTPEIAIQGGMQLRALLSGENSALEPLRVHDLQGERGRFVRHAISEFEIPNLGLVNPEKPSEQIMHPLGNSLSGLTTPLNTAELTLFVNLPQRETPGLRVAATADFSLNPQPTSENDPLLGTIIDGGEPGNLDYRIPIGTLAKHSLVAGITGSGKSTTCRLLISELMANRVPFLVIEPAKDEYVSWAMEHNAQLSPDQPGWISVYMPGVNTWQGKPLLDQLRLNPLDVVWLSESQMPHVLAHIDRLKSILNASFPMQEALPILLEDVLYSTFSGKPYDWLSDSLPSFNTSRPTLTKMLDRIPMVVKGKGYEERVAANLTAALMTRIQSLRRGWKGKLFDIEQSTPWSELFDRPSVINLSQLGDDADKAFTMALILQFLYEYRQAQHEANLLGISKGNVLKHLTVVEEAHRVLLRSPSGSMEQANPQGKVAEMFSNILSEIRVYGEGFMIVDQVPSRLVPDAIKNTNLKIVHRLVADDDRQTMGSCMTLTDDQIPLINHLKPGQAIIYGDMDEMAAWVQITKSKER